MTTGPTTSADVFSGKKSETKAKMRITQPVKKAHNRIIDIRNKVDEMKDETRMLLVKLDDIKSLLVSLDEIVTG